MRDYKLMKEYGPLMDIDFGQEGDVLEVLALLKMREFYDPEVYYFHGGAAYHEAHSGRYIGELDLIIGYKDTCEVVAIGEAKLGVKSKSHARRQLERFLGFLRRH